MKRSHTSWSVFADVIEGPCVVCGVEVKFLVPSDRPDPTLLYHPTCDMIPALREKLKAATPPPLPPGETIRFRGA